MSLARSVTVRQRPKDGAYIVITITNITAPRIHTVVKEADLQVLIKGGVRVVIK